MVQITTFNQLMSNLRIHSSRKKVAVVCGYDAHTCSAVLRAINEGLAEFILVGDVLKYRTRFDLNNDSNYISVVETQGFEDAAQKAVSLVRCGKAEVLMKGTVNTDVLLHAILNKDDGLLQHGHVLTHLAVMQIPAYHKLLFLSDVAVIPNPTLEQRLMMIEYAIGVCRQFGVIQPRIALIHCNEKVNPKFPVSMDYISIVNHYHAEHPQRAVVDGPLDVRVACDKSSMQIKGISSPIDGEADVLIFPNIEAGNAFYKAVTLFAHAEMAGILMGLQCSVVLTSRSDSEQTKFNSLCMACAL